MLALEGGSKDTLAWAAAACRTHDKLHKHLDPLLGQAGVQALLARSARLALPESRALQAALAAGSTHELREALRPLDAGAAAAAATALFGTFFALITTFIGERLTAQALRAAWPTIDDAAPREQDS